MRRLVLGSGVIAGLVVAVVVAVVLAAGAGASGSSGDSAAVAATGAPALPLPATVPDDYAIITVRNVLHGVPVVAPIGDGPDIAEADGELCSRAVLEGDETVFERVSWPWSGGPSCSQTGVTVRFCMFYFHPTKLCSDEFVFDGTDATVDLDWSGFVDEYLSDLPILTARFSHDGVAQPVTLTRWVLRLDEDYYCSYPEAFEFPANLSAVARIVEPGGLCVGTELESIFETEEFGDLTVRFSWSGDQDQTIEVDTGFLLSPTPSPTGYPQSTITVRFVKDGQPVVVESLSLPRGIRADGVACQGIRNEFVGSEFAFRWPNLPEDSQPANCVKGPPTLVEVQLGETWVVSIPWEGDDLTVDAEVPDDDPAIRIKPTPVATSTATPGQLPNAGGPPSSAAPDTVAVWMAMVAVALGMTAAVAWRGGRRRA
ncbi:MAG: hypothetical protein WD904_13450 [Dehalococcoidia bacterium]